MGPDVQRAIELLQTERPDSVDRALALLQNTVFSFSMKMCGHRQDAEDTAQDVLVRALPYLPKFDNPQALASWLYKVARNRCVSSRRQSKFAPDASRQLSLDSLMPSGRELQELVASGEPTAEAKLVTRETGDRVRHALLKLPPEYRIILVLHDMEGMDAPEVARIAGIKPGTVRVRLHRARLFLRRELSKPARAAKPAKAEPKDRRCRKMFASLSDFLDGLIDDATCDEMQKHLSDCRPCEAFIASLERTVDQCRAYQPKCSPERSRAMREKLVRQYLDAVAALKRRPARKSHKGPRER